MMFGRTLGGRLMLMALTVLLTSKACAAQAKATFRQMKCSNKDCLLFTFENSDIPEQGKGDFQAEIRIKAGGTVISSLDISDVPYQPIKTSPSKSVKQAFLGTEKLKLDPGTYSLKLTFQIAGAADFAAAAEIKIAPPPTPSHTPPPSILPVAPANLPTPVTTHAIDNTRPPLLSVPPITTPSGDLQATASDLRKRDDEKKSWYDAEFLQPYLPILTVSAFVFGVLALSLIVADSISRERKERKRGEPQWVNRAEFRQLQNSVLDVDEKATRALNRQPGAAPSGGTDSLLSSLAARLDDLKKRMGELEKVMSAAPTVQDELRDVVEVLRSSSPDERPAGNVAGVGGATGASAGLAAVVNRWMTEGGREQNDLIVLARQIGLPDPRLATIEEALSSTGNQFECVFNFAEDGAWLFVAVPGTQDFFAAPADIRFMGMGTTPYQLGKLFDGMQEAKQGFRFESIYKPCRVRRTGNRFTLVERGTLKLEGSSVPTQATSPPLYSSFPQVSSRTPASGQRTGDVGRLFTKWIRSVDSMQKELQGQLVVILTQSRAPRVSPADFADTNRFLELHSEDIGQLQAKFEQLERNVAAQAATMRTPPPPAQQQIGPPLPTREAPREFARPPAPIPSTPQPATVQTVASVSVKQEPMAGAYERETPLTLPRDWKSSLRKASDHPASQPGTRDVPEPEVYLTRLRFLLGALQALHPGTPFALVHMKRDQNSNTIQIHRTLEGGQGTLLCQECGHVGEWQFALACGNPGAETLFILFPYGKLAKSKFANVYSALADDLPITFSTEDYEPAQLKLQDAHMSSYTVLRKMQLLDAYGGGIRG